MMGRTSSRITSLALALILMATAAISGCDTRDSDQALERNKELVRSMNAEVWNKANVDAIDELFAPDFVLHFLPDGSETRGIAGLQQHVRDLHDAFPDWSEDIKLVVAEGELVVIHYVSSGTNRGPWLGKPPTGRRVQVNEISIFRIEDGHIAEQWLLPDLGSMQQQLAGMAVQ